MVSEEGQMRLAAGKGEKWPGKEEVETDGTSMIKEEVEDERMWGYGSCPTKKNPDFGEIPEAKRRKLTSTMETDSYVTQQGLMAEVKEETALFPTAVVGKSVATAFAQAGGSLPFAKIESDNQVFNAHDFFTNQAILKEELNEDGDGLDQTAHERDSEKQKDMWKVCPVDGCLEKCSSHEALFQHMRIHPKPMLCGLCKKTWTSAANLRRHNRSHYGAKPFKCPTCDKGFNEPYALKKHIRLHTGELAFGCDLCDRKFAESSALKYHRSTHTGEKAFACTLCDYRSASAGSVTTHMRSHTGQKPFECTDCGKCYSKKQHLESHKAAIHMGLKKYVCKECDFKTAYSSHFSSHKKNNHKK